MNLLSIIMDKSRNLSPCSYTLGVERDHGIDEIVLVAEQICEETNLLDANVSLHLKAEGGYTYNAVCDEKFTENGFVYFRFPVTREMTCKNGSVEVEFYFENPSVPFAFTTRTTELIIAKPLTDTAEVESDYPGMLSDVLTSVSSFSKGLSDANTLLSTLDNRVGVLFNIGNKNTMSIKNIEAFLGYTDDDILGLEADFENNSFTRLAGARGLEAGEDFDRFPMYRDRVRCNVADDGSITAFYGEEGYADDGSNGQVMVYQPKFYYRILPTKLEKQDGEGYHIRRANYYISATPKQGFKLHPAFYDADGNEVDYLLYSAYEGSMWDASNENYVNDGIDATTDTDLTNDLLCSVAGMKPISGKYKNLSRTNAEKLATNRGVGWHIESYKAVAANQLLMAIEFAGFNVQDAMGLGISNISGDTSINRACITGSTAELGNKTGEATETVSEVGGVQTVQTESGKVAVTYRGMENPWGNIYKFVNGIAVIGKGDKGQTMSICSDFNFGDGAGNSSYREVDFSTTEKGGYIRSFGWGNDSFDWAFLPTYSESFVGDSVYPVGDRITVENSFTGVRNFFYGGDWGSSTSTSDVSSGMFCYHIKNSVSGKYAFVGARLMFIKGV